VEADDKSKFSCFISLPADTIFIPNVSALFEIASKGATIYLKFVVPEPYPNPK